jgi:DNA-binding NtrC family response regulator
VEIVEPHDLAIADVDLPGMDGIELARHLLEFSERPVILTSGRPTMGQAIEAIRLGVTDYLPKPYPLPYLEEVAEKALQTQVRRRRRRRRYHHMRRAVRKAVTERRALNDRLDLICRDLVSAHRRLVHRVLEHEQSQQV